MANFDGFVKSLRMEFGEQLAGKKFEIFCKWFLQNDPEWSKIVDKIWLWDEYPNKWQRQDLGTDLVFRDNEGQIWAVQSKCYNEHRATTKDDMNSFLADTGRKDVDRRLWMQTTNKMEAKAEKTLKGQDKPVTVFTLNDFRDAPVEYPASFADFHEAKVKEKPKPDPHQADAIKDAVAGFQSSDRGQMIMACGTGKTFTTLWIKEALEAQTALVLLPSLSLLSQTMREWAWASNLDFDILNVCSDKSVGKKTEDMKPAEAPFPVTSDVEEITKFVKQPKPKVVFCTYQSSDLIAQAQLDASVPTFDLVVADEAHRCAGKADAGFATILDGEKIRATKRLFTTATPRYFGKIVKDAAKAYDLAVIGMDDEAVFGPVIHKLTFGQAIEQELLTDYQVVIVGVDEPMVQEWIKNYEIVSTDPDTQTDARTLAAKIGMLKAIKDYDLKRVISFHSRVSGAKQFSDELIDVLNLIELENRPEGTFLSDYVSGAMKAGDRKEKIDRLKVLEGYDRGILTNARCLAEGVDVPSLDGVAFIDPRGSQVEIIQAVGRAIRKVRGAKVQKKGTIVLPVFIEDGDDHEASIEASKFKPVWDVLKALRAHDEVLADILDQYRTNMAKNANQSRECISDKIIFDLPKSVDSDFSSSLRTVLVEATTASWEFWYGLLRKFTEIEGHCNVAQHLIFDGYKLGQWVSNQRSTIDILSIERRQRLIDLGFVSNTYEHAWDVGFKHLQDFHAREGHCNVPLDHKENGYNLGTWISSQRYKIPDTEKVEKLDALDFIWDAKAYVWKRNISLLKAYVEENGHARVPQKYEVKGVKLGNWVSTLRRTVNEVSDIKKIELNELGFEWVPLKAAWERGFNCLQDFLLNNKIAQLNTQTIHNGYHLGSWVADQRHNKSQLEQDKKDRLDELGFIWSANTSAWDRGVSEFQKFIKIFGHAKVPQGNKSREGYVTPDGYKLSNWIVTVRQKRKNGKLQQQQIEELDKLGFIWDPHSHAWDEAFSVLLKFYKREGHCNVPVSQIEEDIKLGQWIRNQRKRKDKMSTDQLERLNTLNFQWV